MQMLMLSEGEPGLRADSMQALLRLTAKKLDGHFKEGTCRKEHSHVDDKRS